MASMHDGGAYEQMMRDGARKAQLWRTLESITAAARTELGNIQIYDARSGSLRIVAQRGFAVFQARDRGVSVTRSQSRTPPATMRKSGCGVGCAPAW